MKIICVNNFDFSFKFFVFLVVFLLRIVWKLGCGKKLLDVIGKEIGKRYFEYLALGGKDRRGGFGKTVVRYIYRKVE